MIQNIYNIKYCKCYNVTMLQCYKMHKYKMS